jgi:predicted permease
MIKSLRYAARQLRKNPTFTLIAVVSLAMGIGATSSMFTVADALLLRPLPVPQPSDVVHVENFSPSDQHQSMSWPDFRDFQERNRSFSSLVAYTDASVGYKRQADGMSHLTSALLVSGTFFQDLLVQPIIGRAFRPDENIAPGRNPVVVLSYEFWRTEFQGNMNLLGQSVRLNGNEFTIVGVAPESFTGLDQFTRPQLFVPLAMAATLGNEKLWSDRNWRGLQVKGRRKPGVSVTRAQADLASIASVLSKTYPNTNRSENVRVNTELQARLDDSPSDAALVVMLITLAVCVLIVACANVAGLLMSRARARSKEIAIRLAIGASRGQLVSQLLLESLLVSLMGGLGGAAIGYAGVQVFKSVEIPSDLPMGPTFQMDTRMLLFTLLVALLSTVFFGLLPALRNTKVDLVPSLKAADADSKGKRRLWGRNGLVISQVAVSMALLVVTALLFQSFTYLLEAGPGFRTDHLLMMSFNPSLVQYTPEQTQTFYHRLVDQAEQIPGVQSAALSYVIPMAPMQHGENFVPEGYQLAPGQDFISESSNLVGPRYFEAMAIPIVSGRSFTANDKADSPKVAIINEVIAHKYFKGKNAVGQRIRLGDSNAPWAQIVGVAKTSKVFWVGEAPEEFLYLPFLQSPKPAMTLLVHSQGDASALAAPLRKAVSQLDSNLPVFDVRTMDYFYSKRAVLAVDIVLNSVAALGAMGVFLSMVGLYGVVAFSVGRRKREIGLRMAIGADKSQVLRMILKQGLVLAGFGVLAGAILSLGARPLIGSLLTGDFNGSVIWMMALAGVVMLIVTLLATFAPAHKAAMIDPMRALREE